MNAKEIIKTVDLAIDAAKDELTNYINKLFTNIPSSVLQSEYESLQLIQLDIVEEFRIQLEMQFLDEIAEANKDLSFLNSSCDIEKNIL